MHVSTATVRLGNLPSKVGVETASPATVPTKWSSSKGHLKHQYEILVSSATLVDRLCEPRSERQLPISATNIVRYSNAVENPRYNFQRKMNESGSAQAQSPHARESKGGGRGKGGRDAAQVALMARAETRPQRNSKHGS